MRTVLTIAGSDSSGGAGIQADLKTITAHKLYGMSAVTALTAQNTTGVYGVLESTPAFLKQQLDCVFTDLFPDAVKIGMVSSISLIETIAAALSAYRAVNVVLDPVMVSTSGCRLMAEDACEALMKRLLPLADMITPNIPEAEVLSGLAIRSPEDMEKAAKKIAADYAGAILIKGGHERNTANDFLYTREGGRWFYGERIENKNTHGTGCTLSSAIASNLAQGYGMADSVKRAKEYISGALRAGLDLGRGSGPLNHMFWLKIQK